MGRDNESTPVPKRDYDMEDAADASPGSSSSSSFANVILPHRQCPGIEHLSRSEIADIIANGIASDDTNFIDEVANLHAALREGRITSEKHRPNKRIRTKTSSDAMAAPLLASDKEPLSSEEKEGLAIPKWQVVKQARARYSSDKAKLREKGTGKSTEMCGTKPMLIGATFLKHSGKSILTFMLIHKNMGQVQQRISSALAPPLRKRTQRTALSTRVAIW